MCPQLCLISRFPLYRRRLCRKATSWFKRPPDRSDDIAALEEGVAFLGAGRELIRSCEERGTSAGTVPDLSDLPRKASAV